MTRIRNQALIICTILLMSVISAVAVAENAPPQKTYIIIHTDVLTSAATEWAQYRATDQGGNWHPILHPVDARQDAQTQRIDIQSFIRNTYHTALSKDPANFAVLLLGDAECPPVTHSKTKPTAAAAQNIPGNALPTWYFQQNDSVMRSRDGTDDEFATDNPYQLMDDADDSPDICLGRIPARNLEEARSVLAKIKRYEQPPTLDSLLATDRAQITYIAGEGHFGPMDDLLETLFKSMVDRIVPDSFDLSMTYAKPSSIYCPPPSKLAQTVLDRLNEGSLLFNYIGHGSEKSFDSLRWNNKRFPILRVADLQNNSSAKTTPSSPNSPITKPLAPGSAGGTTTAPPHVPPAPSVATAPLPSHPLTLSGARPAPPPAAPPRSPLTRTPHHPLTPSLLLPRRPSSPSPSSPAAAPAFSISPTANTPSQKNSSSKTPGTVGPPSPSSPAAASRIPTPTPSCR